ncbi:MAG: ABC transporter permease [Proteobacteria bacterium]|nr:ABC transporter permease [Pseudomonadota bacterium]
MLTLTIAFRNIFRQRRRSLLTGLSMCGGYILFVLSTSLLEGSYGNVIDIFTLDHVGHIQIHQDDYLDRPKIYKTIKDQAAVRAVLEAHEDVTGYAPRVYSPALAYAGDKTYPARVIGIDTALEPTVSRIRQKVTEGEFFSASPDADGYYTAMIGRGLAISLELSLGDEIVLISQGADGSIANDIYLVGGVIGNRTSFDRMAVYLPLPAAQQFLALGTDVHEYALLVDDRNDNRDIASVLAAALPDLTVSPWQEVESTFYRTMQSDKQGNHFMMGIVVFIVFIGVLNTVLMSVLERTREFGVLRAIGCRPGRLVQLVLLETLLLASFSIGIGILLVTPAVIWLTEVGFQIPEPIDMSGVMFQHMKGELNAYVYLMPMGFIFATAALISLPPGFRAARILPRDALGSH